MKYLESMLEVISKQRHLEAIRRGLLLNLPFVLIGCISIMIENLPYPQIHESIALLIGPSWKVMWQAITNASLNIMAVLLVLSTSYFLAEKHGQVIKGVVHSLSAALISLASLMAIIQPFHREQIPGIPFAWAGVGGVLLATVIALAATELFLGLCSIFRINTKLYTDALDPVMSQALACILPAAITIFLFVLLKMGAAEIAITDIHQHVNTQLVKILAGVPNELGKVMVFNLLVHLLWFFGLHGNNIMEPALTLINLNAAYGISGTAAATLKNDVVAKTFQDVFILMGGSGSTLCLLLALLFTPRRGNLTGLMKLSLLPALFNINEILIFGLPIVLNPIYVIPFMVVPAVLAVVSYLSISLGLVPVVAHSVHWTTPVLLSGYLATGSWSGIILQLCNILIGAVIYVPFVVISEKQRTLACQQTFREVLTELNTAKPGTVKPLLSRRGSVGALARILAHDLKEALLQQELFLEYQPQVNCQNRVIGVEALLRWSHPRYGSVPPLFTIAIAEEAGLIHGLSKWVISTAGQQLRSWRDMDVGNLHMSINISVTQLQQGTLVDDIGSVIRDNGLEPHEFELEITEDIALVNDAKTNYTLKKLRTLGVKIAIDDFGAGNTSLRYIKEFTVDTLKIDRVLSCDVNHDRNCQEIIASLVSLCSSLEINTIVEYVETREQRDKLLQLGCLQYQGYFYSQPLQPDEIVQYIRRSHNSAEKINNREGEVNEKQV